MQNYLVTLTMIAPPWLNPVLQFFFMNVPKIASCVIHMFPLDGTLAPVLNIIIDIKCISLPTIQFELDRMYLGFLINP